MNKLILKTALITIAALAVAALAVFSLWILCSPQTMATSCEKTGNYSFAVTCADLRYKYTNNVGDLARCAEDSILSGNDSRIVNYGAKLIDDEKFSQLCTEKDKLLSNTEYGSYTLGYKNYICGHVAAAYYRTGELQRGIDTAEKGGVNAFTKLVLEIAEKQDKEAAQKVLTALEGVENSEQLTLILKKI